MADVDVIRDAAVRVVAMVHAAGRDKFTVRHYEIVLEQFAAFLTARAAETVNEAVCAWSLSRTRPVSG